MTRTEFEAKLAAEEIPKHWYCLTGGLPNEACTLEECDGKWRVYYSERGSRSNLKSFDTEAEACQEFLDQYLPMLVEEAIRHKAKYF